MLVKPQTTNLAKIKVVGVGGGGGNAINNMIANYDIEGVEFIGVNTDAQALNNSNAEVKLRIGEDSTRGLGSGGNPDIGKKAAEESVDMLHEQLAGADMVFITAGMGGGTGTGASPVIAGIAKNLGALTVAIVTKPFDFEGKKRMDSALKGIADLKDKVDTLIVVPNQKLIDTMERNLTFLEAMKQADDVLSHAVKSISQLITQAGLINVDFADVRSIMTDAGTALMGMGQAKGEDRAIEAAKMATSSPLLEISIQGAKGVLFNVIAGEDMALYEVDEAAKHISSVVAPDANVIFGATIDPSLKDDLQITVLATGFDSRNTADSGGIIQTRSNASAGGTDTMSAAVTGGVAGQAQQAQQTQQTQQTQPVTNFSNIDGEGQPTTKASKSSKSGGYAFPEDDDNFSRPVVNDDEEDDLETPSFLRRKKDY
ncbi:cell division protein FtsZ [Candidatus Dojkabacteria bacterium]|nr:cell division protein FtsZ [Candidatus Dojkabacteria bacterium]